MNSGFKAGWLSKLLAVCLGPGLFVFATLSASARGTVDFTGMSARDVSLCEYSHKDLSLSLEIQAAHLRMDHERRGFFRIGILPILVAEDVRIRIASADYLTNAVSAMGTWLPPEGFAHRLELRRLGIFLLGKKVPCLCAATARLESGGTLSLTDVLLKNTSGVSRLLPQAVFLLTGPQAGKLIWNTNGRHHESFFFPPNQAKN